MPLERQSPVEQCSCNDEDNASYNNDCDIRDVGNVLSDNFFIASKVMEEIDLAIFKKIFTKT